MRLYSTPQSSLAGAVTALAILETAAATAFSTWLVIHWGTLTHVVVGACVAPFLLLRTDESTALAFLWASKIDDFLDRVVEIAEMSIIATLLLAVPVAILSTAIVFLIRPLSIAAISVRKPFRSIREVPSNWIRVTLATDFVHAPEVLSEMETALIRFKRFGRVFRFSEAVKHIKHDFPLEPWYVRPALAVSLAVTILVIYLPSLVYRYSLKATAIVYLPIIWILHDSIVDGSTFKHKLEDIAESPLEKLKRWYSWFVLVFLLSVPLAVYLIKNDWWTTFSGALQTLHPAAAALVSAFLPTSSPGLHIAAWHFARGVNAVLTLLLFLWSYGKLRQIERGTLVKAGTSVAALNVWLLLRGLLTLYIIGCTLYIIIAAVTWKDLWPIHIRWFPWK